MGNNSGKRQCGDQCHKNLDELFNKISLKKGHILRGNLKTAWSDQVDKQFYASVESYLFSLNHDELSSSTFKQFYLDMCKGDSCQKMEVLSKLLKCQDGVSGAELAKFIMSILNSILIIQENKAPKRFSSWNSKMSAKGENDSVKYYALYFLNQIEKTEADEITKKDLLALITHLDVFIHMVISRLYDTEEKHFYSNMLPKWKYGPVDSGKMLEDLSILDLFKVMFLNLGLPVDFQGEWRILFSTSVHGESFSKLSAEIINKGPTLIIVKDKSNHIFGGFAPCNWSFGPSFSGDSRSFLFTLQPKMNLYQATNFNENYQYLNIGQQTMPNGLGMGGRLEYFGMWLDAEFGKGYCSESCTTYRNYKMMSGSREFDIAHLEVWGVGPLPLTASELGERSVLDGNLEAKAMLEMAGKTAYSEGLRENIDN